MKNQISRTRQIVRSISFIAIWIIVLNSVAWHGFFIIHRWTGSGEELYYSATHRLIVITAIETFMLILTLTLIMIKLYQNVVEVNHFWHVLGKGLAESLVTCAAIHICMYVFFGTVERDRGFFLYLSGIEIILFFQVFALNTILYCFWSLTQTEH